MTRRGRLENGSACLRYWSGRWGSWPSCVLVYNSYNQSAVSGVTFSTTASDAGYTVEDGSLNIEGSDGFYQTGLIDSSPGFQFDNLNNPDPVIEVTDFDGIINSNYVTIEEDNSSSLIIDDLEEEEILIALDIV